jgi:heme-degrading monooxygenase HmoA
MAEHAHVVRVAKYRPQPGGEADLLTALHALAGGLRGVPGVFGAQVCRVNEHPDLYALVSRWEHEQAMQATGHPGLEELVDKVAGLSLEQEIEHFITI